MRRARYAVAAGAAAALMVFAGLFAAGTASERSPPGPPPTTTCTTSTSATTSTTATEPPPAAWSDRRQAVSVRYPGSWTVRTRDDGFRDPALCFELSSEPRSGVPRAAESAAAPGHVEIRVVELRGRPSGPDTRPGRLRLDELAPPGSAEWTDGGVFAFRERNRWLAVGVLLGADTPATVRETAETVANSLRVSASGRCRPDEPIRWRRSTPIGSPSSGRLVNGVQLPREGAHFFTWDFVLDRTPNRPWRRWGTDGLVRITLHVVERFAAAHPNAPRIGIGDLSRPRGGEFGRRFGGIGHASHQNGLDVDVYYPRRDRRERRPYAPWQVDRALAQDLVDRFAAAEAQFVFVGPRLGLRGRRGVVEQLPYHDDHMHVRLRRR